MTVLCEVSQASKAVQDLLVTNWDCDTDAIESTEKLMKTLESDSENREVLAGLIETLQKNKEKLLEVRFLSVGRHPPTRPVS